MYLNINVMINININVVAFIIFNLKLLNKMNRKGKANAF